MHKTLIPRQARCNKCNDYKGSNEERVASCCCAAGGGGGGGRAGRGAALKTQPKGRAQGESCEASKAEAGLAEGSGGRLRRLLRGSVGGRRCCSCSSSGYEGDSGAKQTALFSQFSDHYKRWSVKTASGQTQGKALPESKALKKDRFFVGG